MCHCYKLLVYHVHFSYCIIAQLTFLELQHFRDPMQIYTFNEYLLFTNIIKIVKLEGLGDES